MGGCADSSLLLMKCSALCGHRLFVPAQAAKWGGWAALADPAAASGRPLVWLKAQFATPPPVYRGAGGGGGGRGGKAELPLALRLGNATKVV